MQGHESRGRTSHLPAISLCLATASLVLLAIAGLGTRWGLWNFRTGLSMLRYGAYGGLAAAIFSLASCVLAIRDGYRRGTVLGLMGLLVGLVAVGLPWNQSRKASLVPPIHDITTDTENPPQFRAVLPLRKGANPVEYAGGDIAAQQHKAYPDIGPLILDMSAEEAFEQAIRTARDMNWDIIEADASTGLIEATDTTFWFGFKDDVVIRVTTTADARSRVDIRSVSRVGRSDIGTNADRIRSFFRRFQPQ